MNAKTTDEKGSTECRPSDAPKSFGTLLAGLRGLRRVEIGSHLMSTHGPLRQFFNLQDMLSRNPPTLAPGANGPLGPKPKRTDELGLPTDGGSGPLDDPIETLDLPRFSHGGDSSAQTASDVNAHSANDAAQAEQMAPDVESPFWKRLTEAWGARSLPTSQLGIAKKLGMSQGSVGRWKRGEGLPELDVVRDLAKKGDVCVEWLLTGRGPKRPMPIDEETNELLEAWRRLNANNRHHVRLTAKNALAAQGAATPLAALETVTPPQDEPAE